MIFARNIEINLKGQKHPMYKGKVNKFDAFCSHLDEIETKPNKSEKIIDHPNKIKKKVSKI